MGQEKAGFFCLFAMIKMYHRFIWHSMGYGKKNKEYLLQHIQWHKRYRMMKIGTFL